MKIHATEAIACTMLALQVCPDSYESFDPPTELQARSHSSMYERWSASIEADCIRR